MNDELRPELELEDLHSGWPTTSAPSHDGPILGRPDAVPNAKQTLSYLDGLRGLAALFVYISHNISWHYPSDDPIQEGFGYHGGPKAFAALPFVRVVFTGGSAAVSLFFVLSGFVLSRSPLRMLRDGGQKPYKALLSSAIRRPIRLYTLPFAVSLLVAISLHLPIAPLNAWPGPQDNLLLEFGSWAKELVPAFNPFQGHSLSSRWFPYNPPVWTMPEELRGSMLVFFLLALCSPMTKRARSILFPLLAVALLFLGDWAMACFMAGVLLAMTDLHKLDEPLLSRLSGRTRFVLVHAALFTGWYLLSQITGHNIFTLSEAQRSYDTFGWYWLTMATPNVYYDHEFWRFWHSIGAVMVVYAVLRLRWLQRALTSLHFLGRVSFSLYLVHIPFLWVVGDRFYRFFGFRRPGAEMDSWFDNWLPGLPDVGPRGLTMGFLFCQAFLFPAALALSYYTTLYIDEPSMALAKWFSAKVMSCGEKGRH